MRNIQYSGKKMLKYHSQLLKKVAQKNQENVHY